MAVRPYKCRLAYLCRILCALSFLFRTSQSLTRHHSCEILEERPPGTFVAQLNDCFALGDNTNVTGKEEEEEEEEEEDPHLQHLTFSFIGHTSNYQHLFSINGSTLSTTSALDRETVCPPQRDLVACILRLDVAIHSTTSGGYYETCKVEVTLLDINDNSPAFRQSTLNRSVSESNSVIGLLFQILPAVDLDADSNAAIGYRLETDSTEAFRLVVRNSSYSSDATNLGIELVEALDREERDHYELRLLAVDRGEPSKTGTLVINIEVTDVNDNSPIFERPAYNASLRVDAPVGTNVIQVSASDPDVGPNGHVRFSFSRRTQTLYGRLFSVDPETGTVRTEARLGLEHQMSYKLFVVAEDSGEHSTPTVAELLIRLESTNDHRPEISTHAFSGSGTIVEIIENNHEGSFVASHLVFDPDVGENGQVDCTIDNSNFSLVKLRGKEFKLLAAKSFDREELDRYFVTLQCHDLGDQQRLTSWVNVTVVVKDVDDNPPVFTRSLYNVTVAENNEKNSFLVQVAASDRDEGGNAEFDFALESDAENWFRVDSVTGVITAQVSFDREFVDQFDFHVTARGGGKKNGQNYDVTQFRHVTRSRVHVTVADLDDEPPRFGQSWYKFDVAENRNSGTEVGRVVAVDEDLPPNNRFSYVLEFSPDDGTSSNHFAVDPVTGIIFTRVTLDRESLSHYTLRIRAKSDVISAFNDITVVFIRVTDENDNSPVVTFPSGDDNVIHVTGNLTVGETILTLSAYDRDLNLNADLTYSITSGNEQKALILSPKTGRLSWNSSRFLKDDLARLTIQVRDGGHPTSLTTTIVLYIVFDDCSDQHGSHGHELESSLGGLSGLHFLILSCVLAFCVVVVIVLVAAICVTRERANSVRRRRRHDDRTTTSSFKSSSREETIKAEAIFRKDAPKESTFLMLDGQKLGLDEDTIAGLVLSLRNHQSVGCYELQRLSRTDAGTTAFLTATGRDRDTDSGCVDVSPV